MMKREILMPDYYPEFQCLASKCKYTCCQEWYISLTKQDYTKVRNARKSKELQATIEKHFKRNRTDNPTSYAQILYNEAGFCPLYTEDGLCGLQVECGYPILPKVCKTFPRTERQTPSGLVEHSCSTGCEKVVMLLMERLDGLKFIKQTADVLPGFIPLTFSKAIALKPILNYHLDVTMICIQILQNRSYSLENRMFLLGLALKDLDEIEKDFSPDKMQNWLTTKRLFTRYSAQIQDTLDRITVDPRKSLVSAVQHGQLFQILFNNQKELIDQIFENLHIEITEDDMINSNTEYFQSQKEVLLKRFPDFEKILENVLVNLFFEYQFPLRQDSIWNQYKLFCFYYSFFLFMSVGYLCKNQTMDDFIYLFTICSRKIIHGMTVIQKLVLYEFDTNKVNSLADMITMIKF